MGAGQSSSSRRRPGDEEIDRVLELIRRLDPGDPGIDTSCQCPITTPPGGASAMPPPNVPLPSTPAPATSPSTSYLRTCTICGEKRIGEMGAA